MSIHELCLTNNFFASEVLMIREFGGDCCTNIQSTYFYRSFHRFGQAKIAYGGPVLGSSQFLLLPQLPKKMTLASKVVNLNRLENNHLFCKSKSVTYSVGDVCSSQFCKQTIVVKLIWSSSGVHWSHDIWIIVKVVESGNNI